MKQRILSALIMLPLLIFVYIGALPLLFMTAVCALIGLYEFYHGYEAIGVHANKFLGYALTIVLYLIILCGEIWKYDSITYAHSLLFWLCLTMLCGLCMCLIKSDHNILDGPITSIGVFYISFLFVHVTLLERIETYNQIVWLVFLCAFGTDIFAYFTGCAIGKHKLCPNISPKKTVEGAIGGIIGSSLLCGLFGYLVLPKILIHCIIIGFVGSFFAMAGDLVA
ncbi:MAG: phosphatidate cytidylyltransferase, partial [Bacillota bacterium]|nr:phosphatidate cytidylyltransferase [Bacillota bacterium]